MTLLKISSILLILQGLLLISHGQNEPFTPSTYHSARPISQVYPTQESPSDRPVFKPSNSTSSITPTISSSISASIESNFPIMSPSLAPWARSDYSDFLFLGDSQFQRWFCITPHDTISNYTKLNRACMNKMETYFDYAGNFTVSDCPVKKDRYCKSTFFSHFPGAINVAVGGTDIKYWIDYFSLPARLAYANLLELTSLKYIVIELGVNDLLARHFSRTVAYHYSILLSLINKGFPQCKILVVSLLPCLSNTTRVSGLSLCNTLTYQTNFELEAMIVKSHPYAKFLNVTQYFLDNTGEVNEVYLNADLLHRSIIGYEVFQNAIKNNLESILFRKKILILEASPTFCGNPLPLGLTIDKVFSIDEGDRNLGNLVWKTAGAYLLDSPNNDITCFENANKTGIKWDQDMAKYDAVVSLVADALINENEEETSMELDVAKGLSRNRNLAMELMNESSLFLMLSLGLRQADVEYNESLKDIPFRVPDVLLGMFDNMENRVSELILRGHRTKHILVQSGVHIGHPLGCPSLLLSRNPRLGKTLETKFNAFTHSYDTSKRVLVTLPAGLYAYGIATLSKPLLKIVQILKTFPNSQIVQQAPDDVGMLEYIETLGDFKVSRDRVVYFYTFESWIEGAKKFDFCFSFRYHGSVVPITAEVPTIMITTDERMKELASIAQYHHINIFNNHFDSTEENIFLWLQEITFDGEGFDKNRELIAREYFRILDKYDISLNPNIMKLIDL